VKLVSKRMMDYVFICLLDFYFNIDLKLDLVVMFYTLFS
jgi:hypothetical protein